MSTRAQQREAELDDGPPPVNGDEGVDGRVPFDGKTSGLSARTREENRAQDEKEALAEEFANLRKKIGGSDANYKWLLFRVEPRRYMGQPTGAPQGLLLEKFDDPLELEEIQELHGGGVYKWQCKGPNPDDPRSKKPWSKFVEVAPIAGNPKTYSTPDGPRQIDPNQPPARGGDTSEMLAFMARMSENQRNDLLTLFREKNAAPAHDPEAAARAAAEREDRRMAHEKEMKKMELDGLKQIEAEKTRRQEEADRRKEQDADRERAHKAELERIRADAAAREKEADRRREEMKDFHGIIEKVMSKSDEAIKEVRVSMEKALEKSTSKKTEVDPIEIYERVAQVIEGRDRRNGRDRDPDKVPTSKLLDKALTMVDAKIDKGLTMLQASGNQPKKTKFVPNTMKAVALVPKETGQAPAGQLEAAKETKEPAPNPMAGDIGLKFPPADAESSEEIIGMLVEDIELALRAAWEAETIYSEVVVKFPKGVRDVLRMLDVSTCINTIDQMAPDGSIVKTPRGKSAIRIIHAALKGVS